MEILDETQFQEWTIPTPKIRILKRKSKEKEILKDILGTKKNNLPVVELSFSEDKEKFLFGLENRSVNSPIRPIHRLSCNSMKNKGSKGKDFYRFNRERVVKNKELKLKGFKDRNLTRGFVVKSPGIADEFACQRHARTIKSAFGFRTLKSKICRGRCLRSPCFERDLTSSII